jgi:molybdate transport system substrate-binding protein
VTKFLIIFLFLFPSLLLAEPSPPLRVAVAANFINALEAIVPSFTARYDIKIQPAFGSSGKLYAQMKNGAPYDLFFSADHSRPQLLYEAGICEKPFAYASGSVVLWSWDTTIMGDSWQEVLLVSKGKIAIANPATAPYGIKGFEAIQKAGLADTVSSRFVYGQSVGQAFVFVQTGNTHMGFVALSQALSRQGHNGKYWLIPEAESVDQWGCVSKKTKNKEAAQHLLSFFSTDGVREAYCNLGYSQ